MGRVPRAKGKMSVYVRVREVKTLRITVFPAAMALRAGQRLHQTGKFQGPMTRITPSGSFRIRHLFNLKVIETGTYSSLAHLSIYLVNISIRKTNRIEQ